MWIWLDHRRLIRTVRETVERSRELQRGGRALCWWLLPIDPPGVCTSHLFEIDEFERQEGPAEQRAGL